MNPDYIFIFLILLIILLFYLAMKYFKFLFFYLWVFLWILLWTFWKIFIEDNNFNLGFLNTFFNNISEFFSKSKIVNFLSENLNWLFLLFVIALFHRFFYYLLLILLHFFKWLSTSVLNWISNRKKRKNTQINAESPETKIENWHFTKK